MEREPIPKVQIGNGVPSRWCKIYQSARWNTEKDAHGKEVLLKDGKFQVMMEWEKPYMQACIDALKPFGDVLEVGFGRGYSASGFRPITQKPYDHRIPSRSRRESTRMGKKISHVTIIEDTWQNALPKLGVFDCIFFDDYPLQSEEEMQKMGTGECTF